MDEKSLTGFEFIGSRTKRTLESLSSVSTAAEERTSAHECFHWG